MIKGMKVFFGTHGDRRLNHTAPTSPDQSFHQIADGDLVWSMDPNVLNGFHEQLC